MSVFNCPLVHECIKNQVNLWTQRPIPATLEQIGAFLDVPEADINYALETPIAELFKWPLLAQMNLAGAVARARCAGLY